MGYWVEYAKKGRRSAFRENLNTTSIYAARRKVIKTLGRKNGAAAMIYAGKYTEIPVGYLYYINSRDFPNSFIWESYDRKYKGLGYGYYHAWTDGSISEKLEW